jgi:hypothetical protein
VYPVFHVPSGTMKQVGRRLSNVTATGDQNSRHEWNIILRKQIAAGKMPASATAKMAVLLGGRDFNFFEHILLDCSDLFQPD